MKACLYGNSTLIVFGGTGYPFGENLHNNLFICNLNTLEWKKYELKGEKPIPLYGSSLVLVDNDLYILFGTNARIYCSNVYKISLKTLESTKLFDSVMLSDSVMNFTMISELNARYPNEFLDGRYRQEVVFYKNKFYTFGGGNIEGDAFELDQLPVFSLETKDWEFVNTHPDQGSKQYPEKRKFHSCFLVDNYVYLFGGMYCNVELNIFTGVENTVWRLDLDNLKWEDLKIKMPILTYFHASCINKSGQILFHGGVKSIQNQNPVRINHLYSILIKIPKLADISWAKLIATYPNVLGLSKAKLSEIGVPSNYIKRIS